MGRTGHDGEEGTVVGRRGQWWEGGDSVRKDGNNDGKEGQWWEGGNNGGKKGAVVGRREQWWEGGTVGERGKSGGKKGE